MVTDGELRQVECDIAALARDLHTDLDQLLTQGGQRRLNVRLWLTADLTPTRESRPLTGGNRTLGPVVHH